MCVYTHIQLPSLNKATAIKHAMPQTKTHTNARELQDTSPVVVVLSIKGNARAVPPSYLLWVQE